MRDFVTGDFRRKRGLMIPQYFYNIAYHII